MKPEWRRFAPLGLYLALAAGLAAAGLYIVQREFNLILQAALGLVVIGFALFVLLDPERTRIALTGRQARYGSNALVLLIASLGILVVINYLAYKNPVRWDLTEDKERTLAPETIQTLDSLTEPVTALAFFSVQTNPAQAQDLLEDFKFASNGKFDYRLIDPEADPVAARGANITRDGTVVLQMAGRQEPVTYVTEEEVSSALIRLANPGDRSVYFITGHEEHNPDGTDEFSYSYLAESLAAKNYTVKTLPLIVDRSIPEDALALIVAGHRKAFDEQEVQLINEYLANGGSLVLLLEPSILTDFGGTPDPLLEDIASSWGIQLTDDLVIDMGAQQLNNISIAIANEYGSHPIVDDLSERRLVTLFPSARSVSVRENETLAAVELVRTSEQTWGETDLVGLENNEVSRDEAADLVGPVSLGVAVENTGTDSRLVVMGDSDFAANGSILSYGNEDLAVNIIDWAAQQENLINLTPRQTTQRMLVPLQGYTLGLILLGTIFLLPGAVIVAGIVNWIQRRRRG